MSSNLCANLFQGVQFVIFPAKEKLSSAKLQCLCMGSHGASCRHSHSLFILRLSGNCNLKPNTPTIVVSSHRPPPHPPPPHPFSPPSSSRFTLPLRPLPPPPRPLPTLPFSASARTVFCINVFVLFPEASVVPLTVHVALSVQINGASCLYLFAD